MQMYEDVSVAMFKYKLDVRVVIRPHKVFWSTLPSEID